MDSLELFSPNDDSRLSSGGTSNEPTFGKRRRFVICFASETVANKSDAISNNAALLHVSRGKANQPSQGLVFNNSSSVSHANCKAVWDANSLDVTFESNFRHVIKLFGGTAIERTLLPIIRFFTEMSKAATKIIRFRCKHDISSRKGRRADRNERRSVIAWRVKTILGQRQTLQHVPPLY